MAGPLALPPAGGGSSSEALPEGPFGRSLREIRIWLHWISFPLSARLLFSLSLPLPRKLSRPSLVAAQVLLSVGIIATFARWPCLQDCRWRPKSTMPFHGGRCGFCFFGIFQFIFTCLVFSVIISLQGTSLACAMGPLFRHTRLVL